MTPSNDRPTAGDVVQAYQQLDETGRRIFSCAFLHIWAAGAARTRGDSAARSGGHQRDWGTEVLSLPEATDFGRALELPMAGIFETRTLLPESYRRIC